MTPTTVAARGIPRPVRGHTPQTIIIAALALVALGGLALLGVHIAGAHADFLLGGKAGQNRGGTGPNLSGVISKLTGMQGPLTAVGGAVAVLGFIAGGIMLAIGHPHGARLLGRVGFGAIMITVASIIVN